VLARFKAPTPDERVAGTGTIDLRNSLALAQPLLRPGASPCETDLSPAAASALSVDWRPDLSDDRAVTEATEALKVFDRYRYLLLNELGLEPTPVLTALVDNIRKR